MAKLVGEYNDGVASADVLSHLRIRQENFGKSKDRVAVYQNQAMDSAKAGHLVFIIIGPERTLEQAPSRAPDGSYGMGWRYLHVGFLNLETNQLEPTDG